LASPDKTPLEPDPGAIELEEVWDAPGLGVIVGIPILLLMVVMTFLTIRMLW
jgi:hypothetical protein